MSSGRSSAMFTTDLSQFAGGGRSSGLLVKPSFNNLKVYNNSNLSVNLKESSLILNKSDSLLQNGVMSFHQSILYDPQFNNINVTK